MEGDGYGEKKVMVWRKTNERCKNVERKREMDGWKQIREEETSGEKE